MYKTFEDLEKLFVWALIILVPLFFLPLFVNSFAIPKIILIIILLLAVSIIKLSKALQRGTFELSFGKFDLAIVILTASYLVSSFFSTPNKADAFLFPGKTTIVLCAMLLYFYISQMGKKGKESLSFALVFSGVLVSLSLLLSMAKIYDLVPQLPAFVKDAGFNPLENSYVSFVYLIPLLPLALGISLTEKKSVLYKILGLTSFILISFGIVSSVLDIFPFKSATKFYPDFKVSWEVAVDTLKEKPLLGFGPGNYSSAFEKFKTVNFNSTPFWNQQYVSGRNFYFTLLSETGFLGAFALVLLLISVVKSINENLVKNPINLHWFPYQAKIISTAIIFAAFAVFPSEVSTTAALFVFLGMSSDSVEKIKFSLKSKDANTGSSLPSIIFAVFILAVLALIGIFATRSYLAEYHYKKAIDALSRQDAKNTLSQMGSAIKLNSKVDRYHASLSQIYILLIDSTTKDGNLTDDQKKAQLEKLIQASINEAKLAVGLNNKKAANWRLLGNTYQQIIPFVQGADQFAIQSYSQAIALTPVDPEARIALGGIYYSKGDFEQAIDVLKLAILAKQDYPNAHYNLAYAYKGAEQIKKAIAEMTTVLSLVEKDSQDYQLAQAELKNLEGQLAPEEGEGGESLVPPQQIKPQEPQVELPQEAQPPATQSSTPTP